MFKQIAKGHTSGKLQCQDSNRGHLAPNPVLIIIKLQYSKHLINYFTYIFLFILAAT